MLVIGVDVLASARREGIGRALVSRLAHEVLQSGQVPYYSTAVYNISSHALAVGVGFWPAWAELCASDT